MEQTINKRVKELIEALKLNPNSFSVQAGLVVQTTQNIIKTDTAPRYEFIFNVLRAWPQVRAEWFIMGTGPMFKTSEQNVKIPLVNKENVNIAGETTSSELEKLRDENESLRRENKLLRETHDIVVALTGPLRKKESHEQKPNIETLPELRNRKGNGKSGKGPRGPDKSTQGTDQNPQ